MYLGRILKNGIPPFFVFHLCCDNNKSTCYLPSTEKCTYYTKFRRCMNIMVEYMSVMWLLTPTWLAHVNFVHEACLWHGKGTCGTLPFLNNKRHNYVFRTFGNENIIFRDLRFFVLFPIFTSWFYISDIPFVS